MSGPPRLPPGISLQRAAPDPPRAAPNPPPNLPPGISFKLATDDASEDRLRNLPSSIQIQRPSSNSNSAEAGFNKLANLGIQISRSEESPSSSAMNKLSGLGISVSGGPSSQSKLPRLPPGVSLSGIPSSPSPERSPERSWSPPSSNIQQRLPPGISIQGMEPPKAAPQPPPPRAEPPESRLTFQQQQPPRLMRPSGHSNQSQIVRPPSGPPNLPQQLARPSAIQPQSPSLQQMRPMRPRMQESMGLRTPPGPQLIPPSNLEGSSVRTMVPQQQRPVVQSQSLHASQNPRPPLVAQAQQRPMLPNAMTVQAGSQMNLAQNGLKDSMNQVKVNDFQSRNQISDSEIQKPPAVIRTNSNTHTLQASDNTHFQDAQTNNVNIPGQKTPVTDDLPVGMTMKTNEGSEGAIQNKLTTPPDIPKSPIQIPLEFQCKEVVSKTSELPPDQTDQSGNVSHADLDEEEHSFSSAILEPVNDELSVNNKTTQNLTNKPKEAPTNLDAEHSVKSATYENDDDQRSNNKVDSETVEAENSKENEVNMMSKENKENVEVNNSTIEEGKSAIETPAVNDQEQETCDSDQNSSTNPTHTDDKEDAAKKEEDQGNGNGSEGRDKTCEESKTGEDEQGGEQAPDGEHQDQTEYAEGDEYMEGYEEEWEDYEGEEDWGEGGYDGYDGEDGYEWGEEGGEVGGEDSNLGSESTATDTEASKDSQNENNAESGEGSNTGKSSNEEQSTAESMEVDEQKDQVTESASLSKHTQDENMETEISSDLNQGQMAKSVDNMTDDKSKDSETGSAAPDAQIETVGSPSTFTLPPGISISSNSEASNSSADVSLSCGSPQLPPGISISPFKKPSARPSTDDDARSTTSMDRDTASQDPFDRSSDVSESLRSASAGGDRNPGVGAETNCVFCYNRCADRKPRLLSCLHSACQDCFYTKLAEARRDDNSADIVDIDGESVAFVPEVTCPICKSCTTESESIPNYFVTDSDQEDGCDEDAQPCGSCDDNLIATSRCAQCEEFLCNDCVRAHQRVKVTKDHQITQVRSKLSGAQNYKYCQTHPNESLSLYCESCDMLNCRDCQLSERHRACKYRYSHEVAPEVKTNIGQSASDIRMKKSHIEESCGILSTKISEVNIKEKSLLTQLKDVKDFIITKVEDRYRELSAEVTKRTRDKRKLLQNRKSNLERSLWQTEYALAFIDHLVTGSTEDAKLLLSKKTVMRQLKRLKRVNQSINMSGPDMEFKLDLYFQHFHGPNLHSNIDSVLKMICSDIKVSAIPIEPPKPKPAPAPPQPPPQAAAPTAVVNMAASPVQPIVQNPRNLQTTPTRVGSVGRGVSNGVRASPVTGRGGGHHVRQLATPTKSPARIIAAGPSAGNRGMSPVRSHGQTPMMRGGSMQRGMASRGTGGIMRGSANVPLRGGSSMMVGRGARGRTPMNAGTGQMRPMMAGAADGHMGGRQLGQVPRRGRGRVMTMQRGRGGTGGQMMMRGGAGPGGVRPMGMSQQRMATPVMAPNRRGRGATHQVVQKNTQYAAQNQMYTNAALGLNSQQSRMSTPQMKTRPRLQKMPASGPQIRNPMNSQIASQQNFNQNPVMVNPRTKTPKAAMANNIQSMNSSLGSLQPINVGGDNSLSSWHTPTSANRPVSPPRVKDTNFKILLPKMGGNNSSESGNSLTAGPGNNLMAASSNIIGGPANIIISGSGNNIPMGDMMGKNLAAPGPRPIAPALKKESSPDIISLDDDDDPLDTKKVMPTLTGPPNRMSTAGNNGGVISIGGGGARLTPVVGAGGVDPLAISAKPAPADISKMEFFPSSTTSDPLADITIVDPSPPSSTVGRNPTPTSKPVNPVVVSTTSVKAAMMPIPAKPVDSVPMVSLNMTAVKNEEVKTEKQGRIDPLKISINKTTNTGTVTTVTKKAPEMLGKTTDDIDDNWCAVCHDGGPTMYCCDRCPKVYHMQCYIPVMQSEPADDWVCIMCDNKDTINKLSNKTKKGSKLSERDTTVCRRLLLEMYHQWPESVPFRDCADLNFPEYLEKIQEPIALDVIRDRLAVESPNQYSSIRAFLADLRKMFRNAFIFNTKESEIYKHAKKMEERLDELLVYWAPEWANDPLLPDPKSLQDGGAKRKRDESAGSAKKGKKSRKISDDLDEVLQIDEDGSDFLSEGEREQQEYMRALQNSLKDNDPNDLDFDPSASSRRGRGRGRPRGRKS